MSERIRITEGATGLDFTASVRPFDAEQADALRQLIGAEALESPVKLAQAIRLGAAIEKVRDADGNVVELKIVWPGWNKRTG